jgi:outer membrane protein OmpA-like peptidoglycan-associated protein
MTTALATSLGLAACSATPERIDVLEDARAAVTDVRQHPNAERIAGDEIADATEALRDAEYLVANNGDYDDIYHHSYLALRHAQIAGERIAEEETREAIQESEAERSHVLLMAREAEADRAIQSARLHEREADIARSVAQVREQEAEEAKLLAAARAAQAADRERDAQQAELRAEAALAEQQRLIILMEEMEAEKTSRGYVLTLSDILFDTDKAMLKPGAASTMDQLAEFMNEYPEHRLLIEGHADARGSDTYNIALSENRANAVRVALMDRGIDPGRLEVKALGESYPLASNETAAGMQENRRVEIIVSDAGGTFPAAAMRTASNPP